MAGIPGGLPATGGFASGVWGKSFQKAPVVGGYWYIDLEMCFRLSKKLLLFVSPEAIKQKKHP